MEKDLPAESVETILNDLRSDQRSGASEIARKAAHCLAAFSCQGHDSALVYRDQLLSLSKDIVQTQPTMASLFNLVNQILIKTESARNSGSVETIQRALREAVQHFLDSTEDALGTIARYGQSLMPLSGTILTHSSSKTVVGILREAVQAGKTVRAIVTESRPFCEGRELARNLGQMGIHTQVVLDAAMAQYVKQADLIIVGADRVAEESFLNKIGTLSLAMAAQKADVPFYVACEVNKLLSARIVPIGDVLPATEWCNQEEWMNVELVYSLFEEIPNRWTTAIITEEGILSTNSLAKYFRNFRACKELLWSPTIAA